MRSGFRPAWIAQTATRKSSGKRSRTRTATSTPTRWLNGAGRASKSRPPTTRVDILVEGVCTIIKGYLINRTPIKIGDKVKAGFLTGNKATNTCLDLYWELL